MNSFDPSAQEPRRRRAQERFESQLEEVLEREDAVIIRPPMVLRGTAREMPEAAADILVIELEQQRQKATKTHHVQVEFTPHDPSPHVVRIDGFVAKPIREVRTPFHATMHKWEQPMVEPADLMVLVVQATDLRLEVLDPAVFEGQFTPGSVAEAYRESCPGLWTRLRRPFIRWQRPAVAQAPALASEQVSTIVDESDQMVTAERVDDIQAMPEVAPELEIAPTIERPSVRGRWRSIKDAIFDRLSRAKAVEEEVIQDVEAAWQPPVLEAAMRPGRVVVVFLSLLCLVAVPAGAVSWSRAVTTSLTQSKELLAQTANAAESKQLSLQDWSAQFAKLQTFAQQLEVSHGLAFMFANLIPPTRATAQSVEALLVMAKDGAEGARLVSLGLARLSNGEEVRPDERLVHFQTYLKEAAPHLERMFAAAHRVDPEALPETVRERVKLMQEQIFVLEPLLGRAEELTSLALSMVGHESARTYLVVFQNQTELRPSGGFMGSYAEVIMDRGMIRKLNVPGGGPYDLRSQLRARWQPPEPLRLVGGRWEFQDANWYGDFAQTASTIQTFWNEAGQPTIDGIVAVNATILPKLLRLTGPIEMKAYGKTVNEENVVFETQKSVELEYDRAENKPKAFVGDLNKEVMARLQALPVERLPEVLRVAAEALETKEIQVWFVREQEQEMARQFGWTGEWSAPDSFDSFAFIGANIAGQKSDGVIKESVTQEVQINEKGEIREQVTLAREHRGQPGTLFYGANNVQFIRLYTPKGTVMTSVEGTEDPDASLFEEVTDKERPFPGMAVTTQRVFTGGSKVALGEEAGRQVIGAWIQLRPGTRRESSFTYALPRTTADMAQAFSEGEASAKRVTDAYIVRLQSQSGAARAHTIRLSFPAAWQIEQMPTSAKLVSPGIIEWSQEVLDRDRLFYVLFNRYATTSSESS